MLFLLVKILFVVTFLYFLSCKSLNLFELETVFRSLIRTFNPADFRYSRSEKLKYIWFFARLFVPLIFQILGTPARKSSNIFGFSLAYSYL